MFTRKASGVLATIALVVTSLLAAGCERPLDPQQYGEVITEVPERLNKPFEIPQLEKPEKQSAEAPE